MNKFGSHSFEAHDAATTHSSQLERIRQMVDDAFAEMSGLPEISDAAPPDTAKVDDKGELIDEARRQRIAEGEQAVIDALETMPKPFELKDLSLD